MTLFYAPGFRKGERDCRRAEEPPSVRKERHPAGLQSSADAGHGRKKEANSLVDKYTIKFEILCGSPAFVILGPYRKENAVSGGFFPCAVAPPA